MKKMKKLFAMLLTLAMVFGMSMTSFAAPESTAKITVKNLTANDKTTLKLYQVVKFNDATSSWEVTDWVKEALKSDPSLVDLTTKPAIIDYAKLAKKYLPTTPNAVKENVNTTSCDFTDLEVGAYLITASGNTTSYTVMGTGTYDYDKDSNLIKPVSKEISAKGETYTVVKTLKDSKQTFVIKGETVTFNIDTVFPSYDDDNTNRTFTITDTPTGMKVTGVKVFVGGSELTENDDYTINGLGLKDTDVTVSFTSDYIGTSNAHAAAAVRVEVTAVVTSDDGTYSNKATSDYDSTPSEVVGTSGSITINKTDDKTTPNPLTGAKFSIKKGDTTLEFVELEAGVYTLYTDDTVIPEGKEKVTDVTVNENGSVTVKGLGAGEYVITETLAPEGYSINNNIPNVTLEKGEHQNRTIQVKDSKLSALPSTGGIGTTIFTIAGCVIMIAAAGLFFASRKKSDNK
ncbi:SpaH/EbpB family LPXTG-anchored major pilin [Coprococcus comes]|uniref:SpaH/EbpB family LPXTG-anchored major pilin n=1 Tax=Coprococcus comes TaxID=410072 RepID=UPI00189AF67A|nr:SpaH/EbpB family LPXTG-anchored major pilin [Coprococcus comes]